MKKMNCILGKMGELTQIRLGEVIALYHKIYCIVLNTVYVKQN